jgi:DNA-binding IclR family transcriptional regulator
MRKWGAMNDTGLGPAGLETLSKANAVLTVLESYGQLRVGEIASYVDLPVSSTYRLLQTLRTLGFIEGGSKRGLFRLGAYFLTIGGIVEQSFDLRLVARDILQRLSAETGWTWGLYVPRGSRALCLERFEGPRVRTTLIRVGDTLPMHSAAGPRAILAFLPPARRRDVVEQIYAQEPAMMSEIGRHTGPPPRRVLEDQMDADRVRGYAIAEEVLARGIAAIGVPIFNHREEVEGAIVAGYLRDVLFAPNSGALELVLGAARTISRALGFRGTVS